MEVERALEIVLLPEVRSESLGYYQKLSLLSVNTYKVTFEV